MIYHVEVTQSDFEAGTLSDPFNCPVAIAAKRATGKNFVAIGIASTSDAVYNDGNNSVTLPVYVSDAVYDIDHAANVEPFSFDLELPD